MTARMVLMNDGSRTARQYDAMAAEYSADNDEGIFNSLYERPAMLSIVEDVDQMQVLDLGCGAGQLSTELANRGATVTGIDVSPAMIEIAHQRLGGRAVFEVGDLSNPLPFEDDSFDLVVASLVMHYIEDWKPVLDEVRRVLRPSGTMTFSTHHPTMDWKLHSADDYFAKLQVTETWAKGGADFEVTYWRRPLSAMSDEIQRSGFRIAALAEPLPDEALGDLDPAKNEYLTTHPHFLFVTLTAVPD